MVYNYLETRGVECMSENKLGKSIDEVYDEYQTIMIEKDEFTAAIIRKALVRRLLKEERNVFDHPMYLSLLNDEAKERVNPFTRSPQILSLIPLGKALEVRKGTNDYTLEQIENNDYYEAGKSSPYILDLVKWTVLQFTATNDSEFQKEMLRKASNRTGLHTLSTIDINNSERILEYSKELDRRASVLEDRDDMISFQRDVIRSYLTFFLLFNRLGDEVNAKYNIMRAAQLNYMNNEAEMLILFLKNAILLEE